MVQDDVLDRSIDKPGRGVKEWRAGWPCGRPAEARQPVGWPETGARLFGPVSSR